MSRPRQPWIVAAPLLALLGLSDCIIRTQPVHYSVQGQAQVSTGAAVEPPPPPPAAEPTTIPPPPPATVEIPPPPPARTTTIPPPPAATTTIPPPPSAATDQVACAVEVGPLWNDDDARRRCPDFCGGRGGTWNGQWWTTVQGRMSVCQCLFAAGTGCH